MKSTTIAEVKKMSDAQLRNYCLGGESRTNPGIACDYILIPIVDEAHPDTREIYHEIPVEDDSSDNPETEWDHLEALTLMARDTARAVHPDSKFVTYTVAPEYRHEWTNDPEWDGVITMAEIERLALEWGKSILELMVQVEVKEV